MTASIPWLALALTLLVIWVTAEIGYGVALLLERVIQGRR